MLPIGDNLLSSFIQETNMQSLKAYAKSIVGDSNLLKKVLDKVNELQLKDKKELLIDALCNVPYFCYKFMTVYAKLVDLEYRPKLINAIASVPAVAAKAIFMIAPTEIEKDILINSICGNAYALQSYGNFVMRVPKKDRVLILSKALDERNFNVIKYIYLNKKKFKLTPDEKQKVELLYLMSKLID
jgi:hypothetical protein